LEATDKLRFYKGATITAIPLVEITDDDATPFRIINS
jgi:hypothetical protein